ncbi:hypothetical protein HYY69_02670 [Candidatus Woesearchaeota archaeon]|nr:hypothetical protein [Candidatus Woesearchaeota archaeon]
MIRKIILFSTIIFLFLLTSCSIATKNTEVKPLTPSTILNDENMTSSDYKYQKINYTDLMHKLPFQYCETIEDCFCHCCQRYFNATSTEDDLNNGCRLQSKQVEGNLIVCAFSSCSSGTKGFKPACIENKCVWKKTSEP